MTDYSITVLDISKKGLTKLPDDIDKYTNLQELDCDNNEITILDNLPSNLQELYCYSNNLTSLDNLPNSLNALNCQNNKLTSLDNLPLNLQELYCYNNPLTYDFEPTLKNIRKYNTARKQSSNT